MVAAMGFTSCGSKTEGNGGDADSIPAETISANDDIITDELTADLAQGSIEDASEALEDALEESDDPTMVEKIMAIYNMKIQELKDKGDLETAKQYAQKLQETVKKYSAQIKELGVSEAIASAYEKYGETLGEEFKAKAGEMKEKLKSMDTEELKEAASAAKEKASEAIDKAKEATKNAEKVQQGVDKAKELMDKFN